MSHPTVHARIHTRILRAWHRAVITGHSLTPSQFLVLCDTLTGDVISQNQRAKRLHITQHTVSVALQHLAATGLVTLIPMHSRAQHLQRNYPTLTAQPTPTAYHLFGLRAPKAERSESSEALAKDGP